MRGNIVMQGYFQDPSATARAFDGGYFHSGDLAVWHPDGSVQIQDRSKDIIISGGEVRTLTVPPPPRWAVRRFTVHLKRRMRRRSR